MYSPTNNHHNSPNPRSSGSSNFKKSSLVHVCKLRRLSSGRYKLSSVLGSDRRHERFLDKLFTILANETNHVTHGVSRDELNDIIAYLRPDGLYRTYYNHIIAIAIRPKKLF